jgi:hypothetical protein
MRHCRAVVPPDRICPIAKEVRPVGHARIVDHRMTAIRLITVSGARKIWLALRDADAAHLRRAFPAGPHPALRIRRRIAALTRKPKCRMFFEPLGFAMNTLPFLRQNLARAQYVGLRVAQFAKFRRGWRMVKQCILADPVTAGGYSCFRIARTKGIGASGPAIAAAARTAPAFSASAFAD